VGLERAYGGTGHSFTTLVLRLNESKKKISPWPVPYPKLGLVSQIKPTKFNKTKALLYTPIYRDYKYILFINIAIVVVL
jgi:hypothetical protein